MRTRTVNEIGIGFKGIEAERMGDIRVYVEGGQVQVWVEIASPRRKPWRLPRPLNAAPSRP